MGGRSVLCALDRGIRLLAAPRQDGAFRVYDVNRREEAEGHGWNRYVTAVAERVLRDFGTRCGGADMVFASDLPSASGMSSSSALIVACFLALASGTDILDSLGSREAWASYLAGVETGVGTHGGSEDHTAILCCEKGQWARYRFCPVEREGSLAAPADMSLVLGVSGVVAQKAGAAQAFYNGASALGAAARNGDRSTPELRARWEQFEQESEVIIPAAWTAAEGGDWAQFGREVERSQELAERLLGNQVAETIALARLARELGAVAASAFGAGYGGAVWALAPRRGARRFCAAWRAAYQKAFAARAADSLFFVSTAGPGAQPLAWEGPGGQ